MQCDDHDEDGVDDLQQDAAMLVSPTAAQEVSSRKLKVCDLRALLARSCGRAINSCNTRPPTTALRLMDL